MPLKNEGKSVEQQYEELADMAKSISLEPLQARLKI